jgi:hypothetical protein
VAFAVISLLGSDKALSTGEVIKKRGISQFELFDRFAPSTA